MWRTAVLAVLAALAISLSAPGALAASGKARASAAKADRQVLQAQQALRKHGADIKADGRMGDGTRTAILNFQSSQGLKTTGELDLPTLQKLGLAKGAPAAKPAAAPAVARPVKPGAKTIETQKGGGVNATKIISPGRTEKK